MPPVVPYRIPDWANPANASVLDSWAQKAIRTLGGLAGVADPVSQVMGLAAAPIDVPAANLAEGLGAKTLKAYHGSPHDFDQFSLGKIGTGEGGQAYGHGLYFAENPQVAQSYRDTLGSSTVQLEGQSVRGGKRYVPYDEIQAKFPSLTKEEAIALADIKGDVPQAIAENRRQANMWRDSGNTDAASHWDRKADALERLQSKIHVTPEGKMYEVNLHTSPDELLDWDKPLSQQSPKVQESINTQLGPKAMEKLRYRAGVTSADQLTGSQLYEALVTRAGGRTGHTEGIASQQLKDAGIKGIQYLDQGSRGITERWQAVHPQGGINEFADEASARAFHSRNPETTLKPPPSPTKNFVIFDDKIIEIAKKYGVALPVAAEIARRQQIGSKNGNVESSVAP